MKKGFFIKKNVYLKIANDIVVRRNEKIGIVRPLVKNMIHLIETFESETCEYFIENLICFLIYGDVYKKEKK